MGIQASSFLGITSVDPSDAGTYDVVVSNGRTAVTSEPALLSVTGAESFVRLGLSTFPSATSGATLSLRGAKGLAGRILVSTDLSSWNPLGSFVLTNSISEFRDPTPSPNAQKFFRAVAR
jgi:hypothetical protein